jgi:hypothetical protein
MGWEGLQWVLALEGFVQGLQLGVQVWGQVDHLVVLLLHLILWVLLGLLGLQILLIHWGLLLHQRSFTSLLYLKPSGWLVWL